MTSDIYIYKMNKKVLPLFGFVLGVLPLTEAYATQTEPEQVVKTFYRGYLKGDGTIPRQLAQYIDPHLMKSLNYWAACEQNTPGVVCPTECIKFSCNYDGIWVDNYLNYFTKTGKYWPTWSSSVRPKVTWQSDKSATVNVLIGKDPDPMVYLKVTLSLVGTQWKIAEVEELG